MAKSYSDKLKDPRWQRKRLEVLERADFTCENCGDSESTLHVHHGYYEWNLDPWEYDTKTLHCLCDPCHKLAELSRKKIAKEAGKLIIGDATDSALQLLEYLSDPNLQDSEYIGEIVEWARVLAWAIIGPGKNDLARWFGFQSSQLSQEMRVAAAAYEKRYRVSHLAGFEPSLLEPIGRSNA